jgi:hypothetical protein
MEFNELFDLFLGRGIIKLLSLLDAKILQKFSDWVEKGIGQYETWGRNSTFRSELQRLVHGCHDLLRLFSMSRDLSPL